MTEVLYRLGHELLRVHHVVPPLTLGFATGVLLPGVLPRSPWAHRAPRLAVAVWSVLALAFTASVSLTVLQLLLPVAASHRLADLAQICVLSGDVSSVPLLWRSLENLSARAWVDLGAAAAVPAAFVGALVHRLLHGRRRRTRHARVLRLVGSRRPELRATVLPLDVPTVYCLPGRAPQVVVSSGALEVLTERQLAAALEHERAHITGRHHLLVAATGAFSAVFRGVPLARRLGTEVPLLLEMAADDRALRRCSPQALATAMYTVAAGQAPHSAFAAGGPSAVVRVQRILTPCVLGRPRLRTVLVSLVVVTALFVPMVACCSVPGLDG
ncbi:M56 family metallopeptidase [Streptomyces sp. NPDC015220]|uniref:M56 family metallopeptidase n=1 Tax=Streptomyces sp. NPDC015220 TaxID=3364947 RepID=UPI0036FF94B4